MFPIRIPSDRRPEDDLPPLTRRRARALYGGAADLDDTGAATAEYAVATMAIVAHS